jgi:hypothetical protein
LCNSGVSIVLYYDICVQHFESERDP